MRLLVHFFLFLLLASGQSLAALDSTPPPPAKEISEKVSTRLGELRTLTDAKNYPAALALTDRLLADAATESYDAFVLSQVKAQVLLAQNRYDDALAPLEASLHLADAHPYLDARPKLDLVYLLAQVTAQLASAAKDSAAQQILFGRAYAFIHRWLAETPAPTPDARLFAASVHYNHAQAATPADPMQFDVALAEAEEGLTLSIRPSEQFYVLMLASLQHLGDLARAADLLELLVAQHPVTVSYWQQLASTYLNLAATAKDDRSVRHQQLRAVLTYERAQRQNYLNTPADLFNLSGLYFNLGQYNECIALLETNRVGLLADDRRALELLIRAYQLSHDDARALASAEQALARFPEDATFAATLARLRLAVKSSRP